MLVFSAQQETKISYTLSVSGKSDLDKHKERRERAFLQSVCTLCNQVLSRRITNGNGEWSKSCINCNIKANFPPLPLHLKAELNIFLLLADPLHPIQKITSAEICELCSFCLSQNLLIRGKIFCRDHKHKKDSSVSINKYKFNCLDCYKSFM